MYNFKKESVSAVSYTHLDVYKRQVEQMPTFPGGQQELMSYLGKNIKYPTIAQENGTQRCV